MPVKVQSPKSKVQSPAFTAPGAGLPDKAGLAVAQVVEQPMMAPAPKKGDKLTRGGASSGRPGQIVTAANRWSGCTSRRIP